MAISARSPWVLLPIRRIVKILLSVVVIRSGCLLIRSFRRLVKSLYGVVFSTVPSFLANS